MVWTKQKEMSDFHKAWYITCSIHKEIEHPLWRKCPKCSAVITYTEEELMDLMNEFSWRLDKRITFKEWFELNKKK